ncbi:hypothetical protein ADUPG1_011438, partial [Aduncisulcus paluster]
MADLEAEERELVGLPEEEAEEEEEEEPILDEKTRKKLEKERKKREEKERKQREKEEKERKKKGNLPPPVVEEPVEAPQQGEEMEGDHEEDEDSSLGSELFSWSIKDISNGSSPGSDGHTVLSSSFFLPLLPLFSSSSLSEASDTLPLLPLSSLSPSAFCGTLSSFLSLSSSLSSLFSHLTIGRNPAQSTPACSDVLSLWALAVAELCDEINPSVVWEDMEMGREVVKEMWMLQQFYSGFVHRLSSLPLSISSSPEVIDVVTGLIDNWALFEEEMRSVRENMRDAQGRSERDKHLSMLSSSSTTQRDALHDSLAALACTLVHSDTSSLTSTTILIEDAAATVAMGKNVCVEEEERRKESKEVSPGFSVHPFPSTSPAVLSSLISAVVSASASLNEHVDLAKIELVQHTSHVDRVRERAIASGVELTDIKYKALKLEEEQRKNSLKWDRVEEEEMERVKNLASEGEIVIKKKGGARVEPIVRADAYNYGEDSVEETTEREMSATVDSEHTDGKRGRTRFSSRLSSRGVTSGRGGKSLASSQRMSRRFAGHPARSGQTPRSSISHPTIPTHIQQARELTSAPLPPTPSFSTLSSA